MKYIDFPKTMQKNVLADLYEIEEKCLFSAHLAILGTCADHRQSHYNMLLPQVCFRWM